MSKTLVRITLVLLGSMLVLAGNAGATTISNPGPVELDFTSGFLKIGAVPEQSIDGLSPNREIDAIVDVNGEISADPGEVVFDQIEVPMTTQVGEVTFGVDFSAVAPVSGQIDPIAGTFWLMLPIRAKISKIAGSELANVGNNCYIGTPEAPIQLHLEATAKAVPSLSGNSQGGALYDYDSGVARLGGSSFAVPEQTGCTGLAGGALNSSFGLPAASGKSLVEFETAVLPVLTSPPGVAVSTGPAETTDSTVADFTFRSNMGPTISFECRLDSGPWQSCPGGSSSYSGLSLGEHTFTVRTVAAGVPTGHQASRSWTVVEATGSVVARLVASPNPVGVGRSLMLDARNSTAPDGIRLCVQPDASPPACGYQWDLDGNGSVDRVTNDPVTSLTRSAPGMFNAAVTIFGIGNASDWESTEFTVEALPRASFLSVPRGKTTSRSASFSFDVTGDSPGATAECSLNGADYSPCASGLTLTLNQERGATRTHRFSVRGVSPGGVVGDAVTHEWEVSIPYVVKGALAVFDGARLTAEIKCARKFSPRCLSLRAMAVTDKSRKASAISSPVKASLEAGKTRRVTLRIKPKFRKRVRKIAASGRKSLPVRAQVKFRHRGRLQKRLVVFTYRVALN